MWSFIKMLPVPAFLEFLITAEDVKNLRFILARDNIFYLATYETFGDVMPDDIKPQEVITIWAKED